MIGKTNATVSSGSSGGGATITAVNKTGAAITAGDKVWLNENNHTAGSIYEFDFLGSKKQGFISQTGNYAGYAGTLYSLSDSDATKIGNISGPEAKGAIMYGSGDIVVATDSLGTPYVISGSYLGQIGSERLAAVEGNLGYVFGGSSYKDIEVYDLNSGDLIKTYIGSGTLFSTYYGGTKAGNVIFYTNYAYVLNDENDTLRITNSGVSFERFFGTTSDNKYVFALSGGDNGTSKLIICKVDGSNLSQLGVYPQLLEHWKNNNGYFVYNPNDDILTCVDKTNKIFGVYHYLPSTESWEQVSIILPENIVAEGIEGFLTLSNDKSRCMVIPQTNRGGIVVYLDTVTGMASIPFHQYNINPNTITGYASTSAETDESFEANVAGAVS